MTRQIRRLARAGFFPVLLLLLLAVQRPALAQDLTSHASVTGRVVGVSDGDTITVLAEGNKPVKVRFNGVDCPESAQPFGSVAKQFTSKAVFGKSVRVRVTDTDRYGRTVGDVFDPAGSNLNQALVRNGYAWWYRRYAPNDRTLQTLEAEARAAKRGLWAEAKTAVAPWEWRRGKRPVLLARSTVASRTGGTTPRSTTAAAASPVRAPVPLRRAAPIGNIVYITRTGSKYHEAGCRHLRLSQSSVSLKDAEAQGFAPCKHCH